MPAKSGQIFNYIYLLIYSLMKLNIRENAFFLPSENNQNFTLHSYFILMQPFDIFSYI